jgi:hypothetical protein
MRPSPELNVRARPKCKKVAGSLLEMLKREKLVLD